MLQYQTAAKSLLASGRPGASLLDMLSISPQQLSWINSQAQAPQFFGACLQQANNSINSPACTCASYQRRSYDSSQQTQSHFSTNARNVLHSKPSLHLNSRHFTSQNASASVKEVSQQHDQQPLQANVQSSSLDVTHPAQPDPMKQELLNIISQPLPLGRTRNKALNDKVVEMKGMYFLEPNHILKSTMRAFLVIKEVLRSNGHVCMVNNNPAFTPLMRHAAQYCTNPNLWWQWGEYRPGTLVTNPGHMMSPSAQPAQAVLNKRGLTMVNLHCPEPEATETPMPTLETLDKFRLFNFRRPTPTGLRGRQLLRKIVASETASTKLLLPGAGNQHARAPTLIVVLDLSHGYELVQDAHEAGIMTASVVNAHHPLDRITYPIYAAEAHPAYTHFFLNWLLKIANLPPQPLETAQ